MGVGDVVQRRDAAPVAFDRDEARRPLLEDRAGEPARSGPTSITVRPASG